MIDIKWFEVNNVMVKKESKSNRVGRYDDMMLLNKRKSCPENCFAHRGARKHRLQWNSKFLFPQTGSWANPGKSKVGVFGWNLFAIFLRAEAHVSQVGRSPHDKSGRSMRPTNGCPTL